MKKLAFFLLLCVCFICVSVQAQPSERVQRLLASLSLEQKIGQLQQNHIGVDAASEIPEDVKTAIRRAKSVRF